MKYRHKKIIFNETRSERISVNYNLKKRKYIFSFKYIEIYMK